MVHSELIKYKKFSGINPCDFGYEICDPSHHFGPAVRENWLLHYVVSGFGRFEKEGKVFELTPGQIFVIPPGVTTYYEADAKHPWTYIWIGFTATDELPIKIPTVITAPELGEIFEDMKRCSEFESGKEEFLLSKIWEMFSILQKNAQTADEWINNAINYIHQNYHNPITVSDIVDVIGFDRCYFSSIFKKKTGLSPSRYLMKLRMEKAATLMLKSGVKPSVAANSVGYDDIFTFSKVFKKHFGVSPRYYTKDNNVNEVNNIE